MSFRIDNHVIEKLLLKGIYLNPWAKVFDHFADFGWRFKLQFKLQYGYDRPQIWQSREMISIDKYL